MAAARSDSVTRYTRLVRWMKILLPLGAVGLILLMFLMPRTSSVPGLTPAQIAALGAGLKLDNPRFSGATDNGEPYEIAAEWALPDSALPDRIDLHRPSGWIDTEDHGRVAVRADGGVFMRGEQSLLLTGAVSVETTEGYRFETDTAAITFADAGLSAPGEVRLEGPLGSIVAGSLRSTGAIPRTGAGGSDGAAGDARIWFENRVRVVIIPESSN